LVLEKKGQYSAPSPLSFPPSLWRFVMKKLTSDSIQIRSDLRVVHRYPLSEGKEWVSFRNPFYEEREVVGAGYTKVRAGTFYCSIIKTTIDLGSGPLNMEWLDYVAPQGLILRTVYYPDIIVSTLPFPDSAYAISMTERMEMVWNSSY